ncbi:regulatory protein [Agromyces hippuratus]|uniref:Regulatory protein RecX n=1 Tax=Agromyces hippuratus TaxID=286438 RepID=A0A852WTB9_9MICO|nr:regulatory protein RecX [Agromyces hippuratus]NYG19560.1 regulatory protein [Agromyces hippuratus]
MNDASSERLAPVTYLPWAKAEPTPPVAASRSRPPAEPEAPPVAAPRNRPKADGRPGRLRSISRNETWAESEAESESREPSEPEESGAERDERIDRLVISRLRRSALSVSEVRAVLVEHGLDDIEVEEWIERYERLGYLDDAKLAEQVVHSHGVRRGRGSGAIMQELGRRGVDNALARAAVEDLDPETELENARTVAERRARQLRGLDRQTAERRLSAFLQRRGYPGDVVREAVTAALAAEGS